MDTPICDFIKEYEAKGTSRLHMPGHKGVPFLGCGRVYFQKVGIILKIILD